jgi:hypothetical protein
MSDSATRLTFQFSDVAKLTGEELAQQFSETEILQDRRHEPPSDASSLNSLDGLGRFIAMSDSKAGLES